MMQTTQLTRPNDPTTQGTVLCATGLYATCRAGGLTEYYHVEPDDGLIYNIGTNPLLQIGATSLRSEILQGIIDNLAATTYTPFEADIPGKTLRLN